MTAPPERLDLRKQFLLAALVTAAGTIPLMVNLNSIAVVVLAIACVIQQPLRHSWQRLTTPSLWMLPAVYFLWLCLSFFWDSTGGFQVRDVERYAVLLIPAALAIVPRIPKRFLHITAAVFIAVTITICICCLVKSSMEFRNTGDNRVFFYHYLSGQMDLNAIFLSNYCLTSIIWLLYNAFSGKTKTNIWRVNVTVTLTLFLVMMILLLSSKLIILLTLLLLFFFIGYTGFVRRHFIATAIVLLLITAAGWKAVQSLGYMKWRFTETSAKKYSGKDDNNNGLSIRILMWHTAWDLVRERPMLGYGVRGGRKVVLEKYKEENFMLGFLEGYHSHNQYLESALMGGFPAMAMLIAMLFQLARKGFRRKNILLLLLLFHFVIQSVIESTFEVQQELVFYILFLFLLYYHSPESPQQSGEFGPNP